MSGTSYTSLAPVYDRLNADIDYAAWADHIERQFSLYAAKKPESVLDLACGTGTMTVELARRGYDMTGIDYSSEMLDIAFAGKKFDWGYILNIAAMNTHIKNLETTRSNDPVSAFTSLESQVNTLLTQYMEHY